MRMDKKVSSRIADRRTRTVIDVSMDWEYALSRMRMFRSGELRSSGARDSWANGSWSQLVAAADGRPDKAAVDRIYAAMQRESEKIECMARQYTLAPVGAVPCVGAYLSGSPDAWIASEQADCRPVRILMSIVSSAGVDGTKVEDGLVRVAAAASALSRVRPVEFSVVGGLSPSGTNIDAYFRVDVPLDDIGRLVAASSCMMSRHFIYSEAYLLAGKPCSGLNWPATCDREHYSESSDADVLFVDAIHLLEQERRRFEEAVERLANSQEVF